MAVEIVPQVPDTIRPRARRFDLRALWRLSRWGCAAALALTVAAIASRTELGSQRLALVLAPAELPVRPVATVKIPQRTERDAEVERLEAQVRKLAADRDHLVARLASLERNFDDITGSIKRQAATPAAPPADQPPAAKPALPAISPPATTEANDAAAPIPAPKEAAVIAPDKVPAPAAEAAPEPEQAPQRESVPLPPVRVASAPSAAPAPPKPEFGVALASSSSIDVMRLQWTALKANFGPLLAGLRPYAAREQRGNTSVYRLVLGPLPNYTAAAKLCARLTAAHAPCHAGKFSGEPL